MQCDCLQVSANDSLRYEVSPFIFGPCIDSAVQRGSESLGKRLGKVQYHLGKLYHKLVYVDIIVHEHMI